LAPAASGAYSSSDIFSDGLVQSNPLKVEVSDRDRLKIEDDTPSRINLGKLDTIGQEILTAIPASRAS